ncbi:helix-turn-helix domain-containing protein [Saliterribacillus persicus]|uniref:AraC family transcriptional regulator n=1 Tax=Saliterribacillus persicus TaxID=930114 RepID=A0A368XZM1_9BACI|nr:helix-turn-helix domain-containing protein [Saliterribacillus persicus]RCW72007.1 AraC family transcriptional regulator [Saliterribacillus persicus]
MKRKIGEWKEWISNSWTSQYFRRSFLLILLIASIPGVISGVGIYWFGLSSTEAELRDIHRKEIDDRAKNIDDQFNYLEESLSYWAFEPSFNSNIMEMDFVVNFQDTREIKQKLMILQGSHPLIEDVELFVDRNKPVLFNPYLSYLNDTNLQRAYKSLLDRNQNVTWKQPDLFEAYSKYENEITLTHHIPGVSNKPFGSIIVSLDKYKVAQLLQTLTPYSEGSTYLLNDEKEIILAANEKDASFEQAISEKLLTAESEDQVFQLEWENETYSISYGTFGRIDSNWTYISVAPISSITSPIVTISKVILIASFSLILIAFIMTWFASNKLYRPVKKLISTFANETDRSSVFIKKKQVDEFEMIRNHFTALTDEREHLQSRLAKQMPQLRQNFLTQLTKGYLYDHSEEDLRKRMENYGWKVEEHQFQLIDVQLTGIYETNLSLEKDESLLTFAIANIMDDLGEEFFDQYSVLNYYDLSAGMFLLFPKEDESLSYNLYTFSERLTRLINEIFLLKATITISPAVSEVKQVASLFEEVGRGKRYREFDNQNQIIHLSDIEAQDKNSNWVYPFELEKEIIQSLRRGKINESEALIRRFFNDLIDKDNKEMNIHISIIQLFSSIQHEILHSGIDPHTLYKERDMYHELSQIREREWIIRFLIDEVIKPYVELVENSMNIEMKKLVDKVTLYLHENYMEDISLDNCADISNTTSYTLSKAFKKILGINFIDYLTDIRINKAKELLLNSDLKINEIAEKVGYRHSYFNRIFKKEVGVPPSQFRKSKSS